ncbi:MAG: phosphatase, partial [Bacteroidetes bacterium]|nr:phosphatase [Bacteroidota bacterium]
MALHAVIDLGTNTFQLLIAEYNQGQIKLIEQFQQAVKLGEGSINQQYIQPNAFDRGIKALSKFREKMDELGVESHVAIATSAIRNASNGQQFIEEALQLSQIQITAIDGNKEAYYIYQGVKQSIKNIDDIFLIMDIGGGSVEFIIGDITTIYWKQSFDIGA